MNAERLLKEYERIADAPDAIARLRRFILDLAVRGKLLPQDPKDEPASALLARRRIAVADRGPFELPSFWTWANVGAVADARLGKMLDKSKNKGTARRYLRNINVRWFDFDLSDVLEMRFEDRELPEFRLRTGDVLICEGGEPGRAAVWDEREADVYFQKAIHRVRCFDFLDGAYFVLALRASADDGRLKDYFTGTGIKHFTGKGLDAYRFPLPPLAEQKRIVAKVDELMALCDQLDKVRARREATRDRLAAASLARLNAPDPETFQDDARFALDALPALTARPDQVKQLRQTVLNLAVRGQLVPQDPNDESANLKAEARDECPIVIPRTWLYTRLVNLLAEDTRNGYSRKPDDAPTGTPILRISAGTVRRDGVVAEEEHKLISGIDFGMRLQFGLKPGDLLACRFNGNKAFVGRLAIFKDYLGLRPIYPDKLIRVRVTHDLAVPEFLQIAGDTDLVRNEVETACATTVGNWGISASNLKEVRFPLPPLAEQRRIVAKVDELMSLCDRLEASLAAGEGTRSRLLDALLHEALEPLPRELEVAA